MEREVETSRDIEAAKHLCAIRSTGRGTPEAEGV